MVFFFSSANPDFERRWLCSSLEFSFLFLVNPSAVPSEQRGGFVSGNEILKAIEMEGVRGGGGG